MRLGNWVADGPLVGVACVAVAVLVGMLVAVLLGVWVVLAVAVALGVALAASVGVGVAWAAITISALANWLRPATITWAVLRITLPTCAGATT